MNSRAIGYGALVYPLLVLLVLASAVGAAVVAAMGEVRFWLPEFMTVWRYLRTVS